MKFSKLKCFYLFCLGFFCLTLVACASKVNQENFEKIQPGMTMQQVVAILGEPTNVESFNIAGLSGTSASWETKESLVTIQFLNNTVKIKTFSKSKGDSNSGANSLIPDSDHDSNHGY